MFRAYLKVVWRHQHADQPVALFSELDDERYELRKVEVYANGRLEYADAATSTGSTILGAVPVPPLTEIAADAQFVPEAISRDEFERVRVRARGGGT